MKKSKRNIIIASTLATFITLSIGSCSNGGGKEKSNYDKRNEYAKYNMSNSEYIDEDIEKFTTFEQMVTYNWYILEINDDGNTDVIITRKTVPSEKKPNGEICYYYKNALSKENTVYRAYYNKSENHISVEKGPKIINYTLLVDYLIDNELAKPYYTEDEMNDILENIKEETNEKKDINNGDALVKKQNHH